jgi:hypothetical protein
MAPAPEAFPEPGLDEHVAEASAADASAAEASALEAFARRTEARQAQAAKATAGNSTGAAAPAVAAQARAERELSDLAGAAASPPMRPATWLVQIRELRDQGRTDEARARLLAFRRAYPHWVIPTDLAPLLRE